MIPVIALILLGAGCNSTAVEDHQKYQRISDLEQEVVSLKTKLDDQKKLEDLDKRSICERRYDRYMADSDRLQKLLSELGTLSEQEVIDRVITHLNNFGLIDENRRLLPEEVVVQRCMQSLN